LVKRIRLYYPSAKHHKNDRITAGSWKTGREKSKVKKMNYKLSISDLMLSLTVLPPFCLGGPWSAQQTLVASDKLPE
jgi:hypothetical protein